MNNHPKLIFLSISDLNALLKTINSGKYNGYSTNELEDVEGYNSGNEEFKKEHKRRIALIDEIEDVLRSKIDDILN